MLRSDPQSPVRARLGALALSLLAAAPLAPGLAQSRTTIVERDSAGIHIVENPSRLRAPVVFTLAPTPRLDLGGPPTPPAPRAQSFDHTQGYLRAVSLPDRGLAVIDVDRVHRFDAQGTRLRVTDRAERGPGRLGYLISVCRTRGDTVLTYDAASNDVAVLDELGALVRFARLAHPRRVVTFDFFFDDGSFLASDTPTDTTAPLVRSIRLTRVRTDGTVAGALGELRVRATDVVSQWEPALAAWRDRLYYGGGESSELRVLDLDGRLRRIIRSDDPPVRITPADVEFQLASSIVPGTPPLERERQLAWLHTRPRSGTWPPYGRIHVDPTGRLWVGDYRTFSFWTTPEGWTAFDSTGRLIGRLVLPRPASGERRWEVIGFGDDEILIRRYGPDGGARLTVYPLVRATPARP